MKNSNFLRKGVTIGAMLILFAAIFTACKKDNAQPVRIPAAGLMVFNLAPDQPALGVSLDGRWLLNQPLAYTSFNGQYQNLYTGNRNVDLYDLRTDSSLSRSAFDFRDSTYYSMFLLGNKGVYRNVIVKDDVDSSASADQSYIRFINAVPDSSSPVVTITAQGAKVQDAPAKFATVSDFVAVKGGDVTVGINNGSNVSASRTFTLENGRVYTALLIGDPAATDTSRKVEIRYIVNGTVSGAQNKN